MEEKDHYLDYCTRLPKIELHAHLNGSIRKETIEELWTKKFADASRDASDNLSKPFLPHLQTLDFQSAFSLFGIIYQLIQDLDVIDRITREVVQDFHRENVVYVEIRTTLKALNGSTKRDYLETVLKAMNEEAKKCGIVAFLLVSINRGEDGANALENVKLGLEYREKGVIGIDLCGNPACGNFDDFLPALNLAKENNMKVTIHAAELVNHEETKKMLAFGPDRVGHAVFLNEETKAELVAKKIPIEICITSNIKSESVKTVNDHHFKEFHQINHPISLCTDDMGVFCTSVSKEYYIAGKTFNLSEDQLFDLSLKSMETSFAPQNVKEEFRKKLESFRSANK